MTAPDEDVPSMTAEAAESLNVLATHVARCAVALEQHLNADGPVPPEECRDIAMALGDLTDGEGSITFVAPAR